MSEISIVAFITGDSTLQTSILEELSDAHRYRRWLADLASPYLGKHPLEIGSGLGDYAEEWLPRVTHVTVSEADPDRYEQLWARYAGHPKVSVRQIGLPTTAPLERTYSSVVSLNVLEHIPDDVDALRNMKDYVQPGGNIVTLVPAFPSAMSEFDRAIGHQRRYTKKSLESTLRAAGLTTNLIRYVNPLGLLTWYVSTKLLRMTPHDGPALRLYDRIMVPVARALDGDWTPFGQSVLAVSRVPGT